MKSRLTVIHNFPQSSKEKKWAYSITELASLFNVSKRTIQRWIRNNKLNPSSLQDIIFLYNSKYKQPTL